MRPDELRRVPSTTVMGWMYTMQFVVLCGFAIAFHLYSIAHDLSATDAQRGSWLFPDRPVQGLNGTKTLYELTWGEVATADAYPEIWLNTQYHIWRKNSTLSFPK